MTCREKFMNTYSENSDIDKYCPSDFMWAKDPEYCSAGDCEAHCKKCWDREYPGELDDGRTGCIVAKVPRPSSEQPTILDSGDRTEFESGAVRDMREGKGRCDLMPLDVIADVLAGEKGHDVILFDIGCFLDNNGEQRTMWLMAALANFAIKAYGGERTTMILEVAKHFEDGAKKYGENNWQKGIPVHCYIDSAVRHYIKWLRGDKDEPHDRAFVWNLLCCIWEVDYHEVNS